MINIKNLDPIKIKIKKSHKSILIYYIGYVMVKKLSYAEINSVYPLHTIIDKINRYIEESDINKYLTLVSNNEDKDTPKKYENCAVKSEDL